MGIDQAKDPPGKPVIDLMRALHDHVAVRVDQQADVACSAGGCREIFSNGPGYGLEIPGCVHG